MSTSRGTLAPGTTPLRIQKGSSRSPSPAKEPLPTSHPAPYTLKPRKPSNGSAHQEGARRTSSSYSSLRSNSLVSNSPFRGLNGVEPAGPRHRPAPSGFNVYRSGPAPPSARSSLHISSGGSSTERERAPVLTGPRPQSKIPTPSRRTSIGSNSSTPSNHHALALVPIASDSDAPAPNAHKTGFRRRQSKGLQNLSDSERVSKSPFIARHPNERQSSESGRGEDEWEESTAVPETSPSLGAVSEGEWVPPIPELEEREHDLPPIPQADIEQEPEWEQIPVQEEASPPPPPPKAPLHARLAAIATRAATPPRALSIDTTPVTSPTGPESPATPISAYKTPLSPPASNSKRQQSTPTPSSPTSPTKSPRRSSALAPSPTRSSLVSKRLLGPRSSPSPRASIGGDTSFGSASTSTPAGVNRSGSNPSKVIVRRGSGVNRRNSRVSRKSSGGRYIPLSRKGSRGANGKRRKTVTFDERCDVLEFDSGVGIDGEVWSGEEWEEEGGEVENGEWSFEEGKRREGSAEASPRQDGNPGGGKRYASPPMVPSGGWSGPVAWGASPAMSGYSPNGSFVGQFTPSNLGHFSQSGSDQFSNSQSSSGNFTPSPSTQHTYTPNMSMNGTPPPNANARYGNLGLGLGMGDAYGFGRQARVGSNGSMAGSGRRVSSGSNSGRPSGSGGAIASRIPGPGASSGAGQAGSTPGRAGSARSSLGRSESGSTGKAAFTPGRSAANSRVGGLSFAPGRSGRGGPGSTPGRVAGGVYGENARDSFGRTGRSRDSTSKVDESGASLPTRESTGTPPTQSSKENAGSSDILSALDSFDRSFPLENILDTAPLKVVNGSPGSDSDVPLMPASSKSADRSVDLENARRETEEARKEFEQARGRYGQTRRDSGHLMEEYDSSRELSRTRVNGKGEEESQYEELSEVVVQHSGAGVVVHHTGGTGAGVVVHHSGAGMVEGVFMHRGGDAADGTNTNISVEGIAVHHSGHSAVQVYDERSPDPSAGDLSLGAGGFSFASLMSFDSIISRGDGARLDDSQNASQRIDEEEEEDELPTNMRVLAGLDDSDLSIKVEETSVKVEEEEVDLSASPSRYGSALVPLPSIPGVEAMSPLMMDKSLSANSNSNSRLNVAASPRMDRPSPRTRFSDFGSPARPLSMARPLEPDFTGGSMNARSPRISRDDVLRRLMDKRNGPASPRGGSSTPTGRGSPTGLASPVGLASPGGRASPLRGESPAAEGRVARGPRMSETRIEIERLMTGVEHGFADASGEGESLGFHPGDESHSSLPYRRNATLEEEQEEEEEAEEIRPPPPAPEPELEPESEEEPEQEPEPEPEPAPAAPLRAPMQSTTNSVASGETETETEEAITPPMGRSFATGPGVGPRPFSLLSARPMSDSSRPVSFLDPGQPYSYFSEASSRPNSYMSASSGGEMSGKEKIRAHEEMILAKRRELRGGSSRPNRRRSKSTGDTLVSYWLLYMSDLELI
ncbi:hypothetical protein BDV93DRAFT_340774 [Ceratobasidium sp. AG-I]|nr:hypothetical protein BDV93DRAFT_340774 [Ceratobasidium sp. AG-I]